MVETGYAIRILQMFCFGTKGITESNGQMGRTLGTICPVLSWAKFRNVRISTGQGDPIDQETNCWPLVRFFISQKMATRYGARA